MADASSGGGGGDGSTIVTAGDLLAEELARDVAAALAGAASCTYATAPKSQPVFSCRTCASERGGAAVGICGACAFHCHLAHELIEVGDRRQFTCDCPTLRSSVACLCLPGDAGEQPLPTADNAYGHNFEGRFCACDEPYDAARDTMLQCISCDEWYHDHHILVGCPAVTEGMDTFLCESCVRTRPFLRQLGAYHPHRCSTMRVDDAASPGDESAAYVIQPWRPCLTCSGGEDDGRGVCLACADRCHAGHSMGRIRITEFACDCSELGAAGGAGAGKTAHVCVCRSVDGDAAVAANRDGRVGAIEGSHRAAVPVTSGGASLASADGATSLASAASPPLSGVAATSASPPPSVAGVKRSRHEMEADAAPSATGATPQPIGSMLHGAAPTKRPRAQWCTATLAPPSATDALAYVAAPVFLADEADLLKYLCRCTACDAMYDAHNVMAWFVVDEAAAGAVDVGTVSTPAAAVQASSAGHGGEAAADAGTEATATAQQRQQQAAARSLLLGGLDGKSIASAVPGLPSDFRSSYESALIALQAQPATVQLGALSAYNEFSAELRPFLRAFAESDRVVTVRQRDVPRAIA